MSSAKGPKASTLSNFRENTKVMIDSFEIEPVARVNKMIDYDPNTTEPNTAFAWLEVGSIH